MEAGLHGQHGLAELYGCNVQHLTQAHPIMLRCQQWLTQSGLSVVGQIQHQFTPHPNLAKNDPKALGGFTLCLLLAESHLCLHTWPETAMVTLDVYVCNVSKNHQPQAEWVMQQIMDYFQPQTTHVQWIQRG